MEVKVIYNEEKAIREKKEVDAYNQSLKKPVRIVGIIALIAIIAGVATAILSGEGIVYSAYAGIAIVIAVFLSVIFSVVWQTEGERHQSYSANLQYYLATKNKWVKSCKPVRGGWDCYLKVISEDQNHKESTTEIDISYPKPTKGITQDIIDFTEEKRFSSSYGIWYVPYERKAKELEDEAITWGKDEEECEEDDCE